MTLLDGDKLRLDAKFLQPPNGHERFLLHLHFTYTEIKQPETLPKLENPLTEMEYHGHCTTPYKDLAHSAKVQVDPVLEQTRGKSR